MFIHRNTGTRAAAVSLGILTVAAIAQAAQAETTPDPFVLVAYSNRAGGQPLMSGDYGSAAQAVQSQGNGALADPQALDTNRCVAYAMTQQLAQARVALLAFYLYAIAGIAGLVALRRRKQPIWWYFVLAGIVTFTVAISFAVQRYRIEVDAVLPVLAAVGIDAVLRRRGWGRASATRSSPRSTTSAWSSGASPQ